MINISRWMTKTEFNKLLSGETITSNGKGINQNIQFLPEYLDILEYDDSVDVYYPIGFYTYEKQRLIWMKDYTKLTVFATFQVDETLVNHRQRRANLNTHSRIPCIDWHTIDEYSCTEYSLQTMKMINFGYMKTNEPSIITIHDIQTGDVTECKL